MQGQKLGSRRGHGPGARIAGAGAGIAAGARIAAGGDRCAGAMIVAGAGAGIATGARIAAAPAENEAAEESQVVLLVDVLSANADIYRPRQHSAKLVGSRDTPTRFGQDAVKRLTGS